MLDLIIKNGLVFDGLGSPPSRFDVGIKDGVIAVIGPRLALPAAETRDAACLWVTPGFIDIHTHYDLELEIAPGLSESTRHGVTTVVIGNCSLSLAVGEPQTLADIFQRVETIPHALIRKWLKSSVSWRTPREYLDHLRRLRLGPNVAALLGHSALRAHVMGLERSLKDRATDNELERMRLMARESLDAGFIGVSIDMVPWHMMSGDMRGRTIPSQHADLREYKMLADVCRERDAVFQVTPNPQRSLSLVDILRMSHGLRRRPLRVTVLAALDSVADRKLWRVFSPLLFALNRLMGCNIRFQTLTEPFTVYSDGPVTPLFEEFPAGVMLNDCSSREERRELWQDAAFLESFGREWASGRRKTFHQRLDLMRIVRCPDTEFVGKTFAEAAAQAGKKPIVFFIEALEKHDTDLRWVAAGADERGVHSARIHRRRRPRAEPGILRRRDLALKAGRGHRFYARGAGRLACDRRTGQLVPTQCRRSQRGREGRSAVDQSGSFAGADQRADRDQGSGAGRRYPDGQTRLGTNH